MFKTFYYLGTPNVRKLISDAVPTLNLPFKNNEISVSAINCQNRMNAKLTKQVRLINM